MTEYRVTVVVEDEEAEDEVSELAESFEQEDGIKSYEIEQVNQHE